MLHDPYAPPSAPLSPAPPEGDYHLRLFHPAQVMVASMFGHVLAAGLLIAFNHLTLGQTARGLVTLLVTLVYTLAALAWGDLVEPPMVLLAIIAAVGLAGLACWLPARASFRSGAWCRSSAGALLTGLASLIAQILIYPLL